jgi:hypothetical protein
LKLNSIVKEVSLRSKDFIMALVEAVERRIELQKYFQRSKGKDFKGGVRGLLYCHLQIWKNLSKPEIFCACPLYELITVKM